MRNTLLASIAIVDLLANYPYLRDSFKGKTKPNLASWSTWTLVNTITLIAALAAGNAINTAVLGATYLIGSSSVLIIAIIHGTRKYTLFDSICQALALIGVILWQLSSNPNIALLFIILVDTLATLPTYRHAYRFPYEETWSTFAIASLGALGLAALATRFSFAALAIPIEATLVNGGFALLVILRRHNLKVK